jgi:hypothetical protein
MIKRDLKHLIGHDLGIEECISAAKHQHFIYAALQGGNECWADNALGSLGKVNNTQCHMPCSHDHSKFCGGGYRN